MFSKMYGEISGNYVRHENNSFLFKPIFTVCRFFLLFVCFKLFIIIQKHLRTKLLQQSELFGLCETMKKVHSEKSVNLTKR